MVKQILPSDLISLMTKFLHQNVTPNPNILESPPGTTTDLKITLDNNNPS